MKWNKKRRLIVSFAETFSMGRKGIKRGEKGPRNLSQNKDPQRSLPLRGKNSFQVRTGRSSVWAQGASLRGGGSNAWGRGRILLTESRVEDRILKKEAPNYWGRDWKSVTSLPRGPCVLGAFVGEKNWKGIGGRVSP